MCPLPHTTDIGKIMKFLKKEKPDISNKQRIAIALSQARKSGARIPLSEAIERRIRKNG